MTSEQITEQCHCQRCAYVRHEERATPSNLNTNHRSGFAIAADAEAGIPVPASDILGVG